MLDLARRNAAEADATNVEFLHGSIEAIPLPDASVEVVISNCVIVLSGDKDGTFAEISRVPACSTPANPTGPFSTWSPHREIRRAGNARGLTAPDASNSNSPAVSAATFPSR
jgi:SAM-dependent methyltransferase